MCSFTYSASDNLAPPISRVLIGPYFRFCSLTSPTCCNSARKCTPVKYKASQKAGFPIVTGTPSLRTKWPWIWFSLQSLKFLITSLLRAMSSLTYQSNISHMACLAKWLNACVVPYTKLSWVLNLLRSLKFQISHLFWPMHL